MIQLKSNRADSEYQLFGTALHKVLECRLNNANHLIDEAYNQCNALMKRVIEVKLASSDWNIDDIVSCFNDDQLVGTEVDLSMDVDGVTIKGRADVIRRGVDGVEVVDFKTGTPPSMPELKRLEYIQLGVYALLVNESNVGASILSKKNTYKRYIQECESSKSVGWLAYKEKVLQRVKLIIESQKQQLYLPEQSICSAEHQKKRCKHCDYYIACHSKDGTNDEH